MNVTTPTGQNNNLQPFLDDNCSICLASFEGKEVKIAACNHSFNKTSLDTWLKEKNNCPICRVALKERIPNSISAIMNGGRQVPRPEDVEHFLSLSRLSENGALYQIR